MLDQASKYQQERIQDVLDAFSASGAPKHAPGEAIVERTSPHRQSSIPPAPLPRQGPIAALPLDPVGILNSSEIDEDGFPIFERLHGGMHDDKGSPVSVQTIHSSPKD